MREIKFRAWENNKMTYVGSRFLHPHNGSKTKRIKLYSDGWMFEEEGHFTERELFNHKTGILMQYTGLKDKNGTDIYEGDIVKGRLPKYIQWNRKSYGICEVTITERGVLPMYDTTDCEGTRWIDEVEDFEVIGNRYENPELLEQPHED